MTRWKEVMRIAKNRFKRTIYFAVLLSTVFCLGPLGSIPRAQQGKQFVMNLSFRLRDKQSRAAQSTDVTYVVKQPVSCESFAALVDNDAVKWQGNEETYLIFIARLGKTERIAELNRSRLTEIEEYLKRYKNIKYVTAEGSRVEGLGKVEIYVIGKLSTVIPVKKNDRHVCSGKVNPFLGSSRAPH
jgi:hypothetical protein